MAIIIHGNITINGNVYIGTDLHPSKEEVSTAKDKFLELLYNKRNNPSWGGRAGWNEMLEDYMMGRYWKLYSRIMNMTENKQTRSKEKALSYLETIIAGGMNHD